MNDVLVFIQQEAKAIVSLSSKEDIGLIIISVVFHFL